MANLTPQQRQLVDQWAAEGANLNQIQDRLKTECATTLTYMETRLLIMELGVKIQDKPRELPPVEKPAAVAEEVPADAISPAAGSLQVTADDIPLEGSVISGKATFTDGVSVIWFMDQMGRFGMRGPAAGYQPPADDIPLFQNELDRLMQLRGF